MCYVPGGGQSRGRVVATAVVFSGEFLDCSHLKSMGKTPEIYWLEGLRVKRMTEEKRTLGDGLT